MRTTCLEELPFGPLDLAFPRQVGQWRSREQTLRWDELGERESKVESDAGAMPSTVEHEE